MKFSSVTLTDMLHTLCPRGKERNYPLEEVEESACLCSRPHGITPGLELEGTTSKQPGGSYKNFNLYVVHLKLILYNIVNQLYPNFF